MMATADVDGKIGYEESKIQHKMDKGMATTNSTAGGSQNLNGMQHRATPIAGFSLHPEPVAAKPGLSSMREEGVMEEEEDFEEAWDNELSAEAQAHNISMFLSSSTGSDSGEEPTVSDLTVITNVYKDPLGFCMEGIEEMARKILKTGKLAITGEPGDMSKIQPAMFSLQASEKEMGQLVPQMLQMPLFCQGESGRMNMMESFDYGEEDESFMTVTDQDEALANGNIRVAIPVDTAIYTLLRSHCAKGARQAEEVINTAMRNTYIPAQVVGTFSSMPPIVKFNSAPRRHSNISNNGSSSEQTSETVRDHLALNKDKQKQTSTSSISTDEWSTTNSAKQSQSSMSMHTSFGSLPGSEASASDINLAASGHFEEFGGRSVSPYMSPDGSAPPRARSRSSDLTLNGNSIKEEDESTTTTTTTTTTATATTTTPKHKALMKTMSNKVRRTSTVLQPPAVHHQRSRGDSTGSDVSLSESGYLLPGLRRWNTSILENNTIVAQYSGIPYPIVWWEPGFKIDFRLSTSVGLLSGTVTGIDPSIPEVTLKVFNNSPRQIGFAIRSHRQSSVFSSHVVYPNKGLQILEPHKTWEDNVEFYSNTPNTAEMFIIDLFFCTLDSKPVWNIVRKYAIMKAHKSAGNLRRVSKRRQSHLQLPGSKEVKGENLELVLSHGLQCVVKGKLSEAEIIFSQALYLPDFQRVPLKAFVCICLAVIANKRIKQGQGTSLMPVMMAVESSSKLVSICEEGPGSSKMSYTIQLVKQLKKELNLQKLMKEHKRTGHTKSKKIDETVVEEFKDITPESGGELDHKHTKVSIPPGALTQTTSISLSLAGSRQLISMLKASGWGKIVQVATAIHIECNPPIDQLKKPIQIKTQLPGGSNLGPTSLVRLMHSNYLRHWEDITDDVFSKISVSGEDVYIETNLPGWLAVSVIQFDASMIAEMVLKSISIEPIMLRLSVFGFIDAERKSIQIAIFAVPCKANEEPIHKDVEKPENFIPISFPHVVQAFPNEKLQLKIQGTFEPDVSLGENSLTFQMDVQQKHNQIHTKWVKSTTTSDLPPSGKLNVSSCRDNSNSWENIASISLSMRTNLNISSSPKESTSSGE